VGIFAGGELELKRHFFLDMPQAWPQDVGQRFADNNNNNS